MAPARGYLYVAWSNGGASYAGGSGGAGPGDRHGVTAFRIGPSSGALAQDGQPIALHARPIHVTTDVPGTHLLVAYNAPSGVTVHGIRQDGIPVPSHAHIATRHRHLRSSGPRAAVEPV
jgi:6-phosphogluconolactonase (cycloisomerase 2 family)